MGHMMFDDDKINTCSTIPKFCLSTSNKIYIGILCFLYFLVGWLHDRDPFDPDIVINLLIAIGVSYWVGSLRWRKSGKVDKKGTRLFNWVITFIVFFQCVVAINSLHK